MGLETQGHHGERCRGGAVPKLQFLVSQIDDVQVITVIGAVDASNADELSTVLATCECERPLSIAMASTRFLDAAGIGVLVAQWPRWKEAGSPIFVIEPSDAVRRILTLTGLAGMFDPSAEEIGPQSDQPLSPAP